MKSLLSGFVLFCLLIFQITSVGASCKTESPSSTIALCEKKLSVEPTNSQHRLTLADAYLSMDEREQAIQVLKRGIELTPGNNELKNKLIYIESLESEEEWIKRTRKKNQSKKLHLSTQQKLASIRCNSNKGEKALELCTKALEQYPDASDLLSGKGKALLELDRVVEAIVEFKHALKLDSTNTDASDGLNSANAQRKVLVDRCLQSAGKQTALNACNNALYKGAPDEYILHFRRGELLLSMNKKQEAIKAYRSAKRARPSDKKADRMLAKLTENKKEPVNVVKQEQRVPSVEKTEKLRTTVKPNSTVIDPVASASLEPQSKKSVEKPLSEPETAPVILSSTQKDAKPILQAKAPVSDDTRADQIKPIDNQHRFSNSPVAEGITY